MQKGKLVDQWLEIARGRRSIRRFKPTPVPPEAISLLLSSANWAPSAHNNQPWRFAIITDPDTRSDLAQAMGQRLREDLVADGREQESIDADVGRSFSRIVGAPLLILVCLSMIDMDDYTDKERQDKEWTMAVQSTAMAGQNLLLAAHALGIGACWLCAPLFCQDTVRKTLNLPSDWQPQGLITVGYPDEVKVKTRRSIDELVLRFDAKQLLESKG